jgi:hypothetical protein
MAPVGARELSDLKCRKAKAANKPYRIADRGGLHLLVTPEGGKLWRWEYRFDGKQKQMALGKYPDVSLAVTRTHHAQARQLLDKGTDPMALRKQARVRKKAERIVVKEPVCLTIEFHRSTRQLSATYIGVINWRSPSVLCSAS